MKSNDDVAQTLKKPKVFVIEPTRKELHVDRLQAYGDVKFIFEPNDRRCSVFQHDQFGRLVIDRLNELSYDHNADHLCIVGSVVAIVVTVTALAQHFGRFNALIFDAINANYVPRTFDPTLWS